MANGGAQERLDPRIRLVVGGSFLTVAVRMGLVSFLSVYFVREAGIALTTVGIAFLVENLARGALAPWVGALSDRFGRRPVIIIGMFMNAAVLPCFLLVQGPASLMLWSLVMGIVGTTQWTIATALVLDLAPASRRQYALAIHYTLVNLGYSLGIIPGGFLAEKGYGVLAAITSAGYFTVGLLYWAILRGPLPQERMAQGTSPMLAALGVLSDRVFLGFAACGFVFPLSIGLFSFVSAIHGADRGLTESFVGMVLGANGIIVALLTVPVAKRIEGAGPYRLLGPAALLLAGSYVCYALIGDAATSLVAGMLMFTLADLIFGAAAPTAISHLAPAGLRGTYQGAWSMVGSVVIGSSLYVSGLLKGMYSWSAAWLVFAAVTAAAGIGLIAAREIFRSASIARGATTSAS